VINKNAAQRIKYYCGLNGITYLKSNSSSQGGSQSHSFAANLSQVVFGDSYELFFYLDHDCFPVKDFSVSETLGDLGLMAGVAQAKAQTYLWPGCLMFKRGIGEIDFSPLPGLDTGGGLYKLVNKHGDRIVYFSEEYEENPEFQKGKYKFYSLINDRTFLHFINGSNWNNSNDHRERINSLINILKKA
jgi:hypothetical protein